MKHIIVVFKKEVLDNLRDKRSVFFALLYGPILLPLLMVGPMAMGVKKFSIDYEQTQKIQMVAPQSAPNFVQYLLEHNIEVITASDDFKEKIKSQKIVLTIALDEDFEDALRQGRAAVIRLYYNKKNDDSDKAFRLVSRVVQQYNQSLVASRLDLRGLDVGFLTPMNILEQDLGEVDGGEKAISMIVPFIIVLSLTMGGFYLAVDMTAGERERHSLEPLLSLSISRRALVLGKLLNLMLFVIISASLAIFSTFLLFSYIPVEELRVMIQVEAFVFVKLFLLCLPMAPLFSAAMMLIATYARDTKEAQTHLGLSMMVPMAPFFIMQFSNIHNQDNLLFVPVMSQFILIEQLVTGASLTLQDILVSSGCTLGIAAAFFILILKLYSQESILGK